MDVRLCARDPDMLRLCSFTRVLNAVYLLVEHLIVSTVKVHFYPSFIVLTYHEKLHMYMYIQDTMRTLYHVVHLLDLCFTEKSSARETRVLEQFK